MKIISNQVHDQITGKLYKHLHNQIGVQVYIEVRDRISVPIYNEVRNGVSNNIDRISKIKQNTLI
jgi:CRISPR/Cas system-associated exonuclease Cas4 (RecB family)